LLRLFIRKNKFTLKNALQAKKNNTLELWVQNFLRGEGENLKLADVLKEDRKIWVDLVQYDLSKLLRITGPEKEMTFREDQKKWEQRVNAFVELIKNGYESVPLIVTDLWGDFHISDGNHRAEALKRTGVQKYWTIFYLENPDNAKIILDNISNP
jgi:hypothetical protein